MNNPQKTGQRLVATLVVSQSLFSAAQILVFTIASIVAVDLAGGKNQWTGVSSTVGLVGAALIANPIGRLMDRAGRRVGLSLGHLFGIVGAAVAGWAVLQESLLLFLVGIFLLGMARGAVELGRYAAAEASLADRRGRAISLVVLAGTVGSVAGPTLIALSGRFAAGADLPELSGPWFLGSAILVVALLVVYLFLRPDPKEVASQLEADEAEETEPDDKGRAFGEIVRDPRSKLAIGAMVAGQVAMVVVMTVTAVYMRDLGHELEAISLVIMAHTLGMFGLSFVTGWLVDKVGRDQMILAGGVILIVACATAPLSERVMWLALALFLLGLGWNFAFVAGSTLLDDVLKRREKGRVQGTVDALVKLSSGASTLGSGFVFAATSFALTSWAMLAVAVVPVAMVVLFRMTDRDRPLRGAVSG